MTHDHDLLHTACTPLHILQGTVKTELFEIVSDTGLIKYGKDGEGKDMTTSANKIVGKLIKHGASPPRDGAPAVCFVDGMYNSIGEKTSLKDIYELVKRCALSSLPATAAAAAATDVDQLRSSARHRRTTYCFLLQSLRCRRTICRRSLLGARALRYEAHCSSLTAHCSPLTCFYRTCLRRSLPELDGVLPSGASAPGAGAAAAPNAASSPSSPAVGGRRRRRRRPASAANSPAAAPAKKVSRMEAVEARLDQLVAQLAPAMAQAFYGPEPSRQVIAHATRCGARL